MTAWLRPGLMLGLLAAGWIWLAPRPDSAPGLCNLLAFVHDKKSPGDTQATVLALDRSLVDLGL